MSQVGTAAFPLSHQESGARRLLRPLQTVSVDMPATAQSARRALPRGHDDTAACRRIAAKPRSFVVLQAGYVFFVPVFNSLVVHSRIYFTTAKAKSGMVLGRLITGC